MDIKDLKILSKQELTKEYPELIALLNQLPEHPSSELIASLIINICPHCCQNYTPCHCWNDD